MMLRLFMSADGRERHAGELESRGGALQAGPLRLQARNNSRYPQYRGLKLTRHLAGHGSGPDGRGPPGSARSALGAGNRRTLAECESHFEYW